MEMNNSHDEEFNDQNGILHCTLYTVYSKPIRITRIFADENKLYLAYFRDFS
jgi:hypothetical protein